MKYSCKAERRAIEIADTFMEKGLQAYMTLIYDLENRARRGYNRGLKLKVENTELRAEIAKLKKELRKKK